jgi:hypothetical protein
MPGLRSLGWTFLLAGWKDQVLLGAVAAVLGRWRDARL